MVYFRYIKGNAEQANMPYIIFIFVRQHVKKALYFQGYGRHSDEECNQLTFLIYFHQKIFNNVILWLKFKMMFEFEFRLAILFGYDLL